MKQTVAKILSAIVVAISLASCGASMPKVIDCGNGKTVQEGQACPIQPVVPPTTPPVTPPATDPIVTESVLNALPVTTKFKVCGSEVRLRNMDGSVTYFQGPANGKKLLEAAKKANANFVVLGKVEGDFFTFTSIPELQSSAWAGVGTELMQDGKQGTYPSPGCK